MKRCFHLLFHFPNGYSLSLGQAEAKSQEFRVGLPMYVAGAHIIGLFAAFSRSWNRSGAARA